jgi:hypothetical protein
MARYKISTEQKKSVVELERWINTDTEKLFTIEHGWRWGEWFIESDNPSNIILDAGDGQHLQVLLGFSTEVIDTNLDDGCWCEFGFDDDFSPELIEQIEKAWEDEGADGLEQLGFEHYDTETRVSGPLLLEKVED